MAIQTLNSLEMLLLASAFSILQHSNPLPHVIWPGRECAIPLVNNCRGARLMGIRETRNVASPAKNPVVIFIVAANANRI